MKWVFDEHRGDQQQMEALNVNLHFKWKTVDWFGVFFWDKLDGKWSGQKNKTKTSFCLTPKIPNNDMNQTGRAMWQNIIVHLAITLNSLCYVLECEHKREMAEKWTGSDRLTGIHESLCACNQCLVYHFSPPCCLSYSVLVSYGY